MKSRRVKKVGLAMVIISSATIASEAAVLVTVSPGVGVTDITFAVTEGVYTTEASKSAGFLIWDTGASGSSSTSATTSTSVVSDTLNYSVASFTEATIISTGSNVHYVRIFSNGGGEQTVQNGAITFRFNGDLSGLNFGNLPFDTSGSIGTSASFSGVSADLSAVPEPSSVVLTLLGASCLLLRRKR